MTHTSKSDQQRTEEKEKKRQQQQAEAQEKERKRHQQQAEAQERKREQQQQAEAQERKREQQQLAEAQEKERNSDQQRTEAQETKNRVPELQVCCCCREYRLLYIGTTLGFQVTDGDHPMEDAQSATSISDDEFSIDDFSQLSASDPFITYVVSRRDLSTHLSSFGFRSPLLVHVLSSPIPIKRGGDQMVSNIQLSDMKGKKVRMSLWNEKAKQQEALANFTVVCFCADDFRNVNI
jgi:flagellar biosynthesis GTPase FlhF